MSYVSSMRKEIARLGDGKDKRGRWWYSPFDFGFATTNRPDMTFEEHAAHPSFGMNKWEKYIKPNLPYELTGKNIVDVGCNCGLYALQAIREGANVVYGIEADPGDNGFTDQALLLRDFCSIKDGVDYTGRFVIINEKAEDVDFVKRFKKVGLVFCFNVLYWSSDPKRLAEQIASACERVMVMGDDHVDKPLAKFEPTKKFLSKWFEVESGKQYKEKGSKAFNVIIGRAR